MADAQIDILKTSIDWAKAEIFSSSFFALMGLLFILTSIDFGSWVKQVRRKPSSFLYL